MIKIFFLSVTGLMSIASMSAQNLDVHKWKNRILVIQSPGETNSNHRDQMVELLNMDEELCARKILVIEVVGNKYRKKNYLSDINNAEWNTLTDIRSKIIGDVSTFKVSLIGLDGEIKLEQNCYIRIADLFRKIDSMPMRKSELRNK